MEPSVDLAHGPLRVSDNSRFLVHEDGTPFFYLGDTAWELFHRAAIDEARTYLEDRARKRFTVIQAVVLAELDGLHTPSACGELPLVDDDPDRPNEAYFAHVDAVVRIARDLGLFIGMLPTWGDKWHKKWGVGPVIFTPDNARRYGAFLGERYRDEPIIWILGGDRNPDEPVHVETIRAMAAGLASGDNDGHLMTFHPQGGASSSRWFHDEPWLDFNMLQSGQSSPAWTASPPTRTTPSTGTPPTAGSTTTTCANMPTGPSSPAHTGTLTAATTSGRCSLPGANRYPPPALPGARPWRCPAPTRSATSAR
jgi:hypothetical protein